MNQAVIEQDGMSRNTPANPTPDSLTGLLLPLSDRTLLLPNVAVAELIAYRNPQVAAGVPQWYLGQVAWRDLRLPLLSFEAASSGEQQPVLGSSARVVVINALGGRPHVKFLALLVQGHSALGAAGRQSREHRRAAGGAGTGGGGHRRRNRADSGPGRAREARRRRPDLSRPWPACNTRGSAPPSGRQRQPGRAPLREAQPRRVRHQRQPLRIGRCLAGWPYLPGRQRRPDPLQPGADPGRRRPRRPALALRQPLSACRRTGEQPGSFLRRVRPPAAAQSGAGPRVGR